MKCRTKEWKILWQNKEYMMQEELLTVLESQLKHISFKTHYLYKKSKRKRKLSWILNVPGLVAIKGHKTNKSTLYKYWGKTNDDAFVKALENYLSSAYPDHDGKKNNFLSTTNNLWYTDPDHRWLLFLDGSIIVWL